MQCNEMFKDTCSQGHKLQWRCYTNGPPICSPCKRDAEEKARKQKREFELQAERDRKQKEYAKALEEWDVKMELEKQKLADARLEKERKDGLARKQKDFEDLKARTTVELNSRNQANLPKKSSSAEPVATAPDPTQSPPDSPDATNPSSEPDATATADTQEPLNETSPAFDDWEHQKNIGGCRNDQLDALMKMIGLEEVKQKFLKIKAKVDLSIRQCTDMKNERFGAALLGNPGTGMFFFFL